jgi:hypothetical protein
MSIFDYFPSTTTILKKGGETTTRRNPPEKNVSEDIKILVQNLLGMFKGKEDKLLSPIPDTTPVPLPTATPDPEQIARQMTMDYNPYIVDQSKINKNYPQGLPQPSLEQKQRILSISPEDATRSAILKIAETGGFNDYPEDYTGNTNKTIDRGPNMINSGTFYDMWNKEGTIKGTYPHRERMINRGITSFEDMKDPVKNEKMMDLVRKAQGYEAWYGPEDKGFNLSQ